MIPIHLSIFLTDLTDFIDQIRAVHATILSDPPDITILDYTCVEGGWIVKYQFSLARYLFELFHQGFTWSDVAIEMWKLKVPTHLLVSFQGSWERWEERLVIKERCIK